MKYIIAFLLLSACHRSHPQTKKIIGKYFRTVDSTFYLMADDGTSMAVTPKQYEEKAIRDTATSSEWKSFSTFSISSTKSQ